MTDAAEVQVTDSKAGRCFYVAHAYLTTGKQLEAHALFGRAADHAKEAVRQHQVRLCVVPQNNHMTVSGYSPLLSIFWHHSQMLFAACRVVAWAIVSTYCCTLLC